MVTNKLNIVAHQDQEYKNLPWLWEILRVSKITWETEDLRINLWFFCFLLYRSWGNVAFMVSLLMIERHKKR